MVLTLLEDPYMEIVNNILNQGKVLSPNAARICATSKVLAQYVLYRFSKEFPHRQHSVILKVFRKRNMSECRRHLYKPATLHTYEDAFNLAGTFRIK